MPYTIGKDGQVMDETGKPLEFNGSPLTVETDSFVKDRLERERRNAQSKYDELDTRMKALQEQANRTPTLENLLETTRLEKQDIEKSLKELETKATEAERLANEKVASQIAEAKRERDELRTALAQEQSMRMREQVSNLILGNAGDKFNAPALDIVPNLLAVHKREPILDDSGKPTNNFNDLFEISYNRDNKLVTELMTVDKALEYWAEKYPHHVKASNRGGSGGGNYTGKSSQNRSQMTVKEKAEFINKFGSEAYQNLPE